MADATTTDLKQLSEQLRSLADYAALAPRAIDTDSPLYRDMVRYLREAADALAALLSASQPSAPGVGGYYCLMADGFEKNGIRLYVRVVCIDVPRLHGAVIRCAADGVDVLWDDGKIGELVWREDVAYNAYRLQVVKMDADHG